RKERKGTRSGVPRPAKMTDYIRQHQLLPIDEIEQLIEEAPAEILENQARYANGLEIPEWHDFIEAFTPEDAVNDRLPILNQCQALCEASSTGLRRGALRA